LAHVERQWPGSGLSVRHFCAEREVLEPSFYAWRRLLKRHDTEAVQLVPLQDLPELRSGRAAEQASAGLELVLAGGPVMRIGPGFDTATLQGLLPLLEEGRP
jgi:hypothetical protein